MQLSNRLGRLNLTFVALTSLACSSAVHALPQTADDPKPAAATTQKEAPLPTAKEIVAKMIEFQGGEKVLASPKPIHAVGSFSIPMMNLTGKLETWSAPPNYLLVQMDIPAMGGMSSQGFNGKVGWAIDPINGARILEGAMLKSVARDADQRGDLDLFKVYDSVKVTGREKFQDVDCVVLELKVDDTTTLRFVDPATGRMVGSRSIMPTPQGDIPVETVIAEWKTVNGRTTPVDTRMTMMGMEQVMKIDTLEVESPDPKRFALPPAIEALVAETEKNATKNGEKLQKKDSTPAAENSTTGGE